ncbi:MAG: hypothetical protein AMXMBFR36_16510 [Acidobacteriota bacterium]
MPRRSRLPLLLLLPLATACRPPAERVDLVRLLPTAELHTEVDGVDVGRAVDRIRLYEGFTRDAKTRGVTWAWAYGERSRVAFDVIDPRPVRLAMRGWSQPEPGGVPPEIAVVVNGLELTRVIVPAEPTTLELELGAERLRSGENLLELRYPEGSTGPVAGIAWDRFGFGGLGSSGRPAVGADGAALELPWRTSVELALEAGSGAAVEWRAVEATGGEGRFEVAVAVDGEPERILHSRGPGGSGRVDLPEGDRPLKLTLRAVPAGRATPSGGLRLVEAKLATPRRPAPPAPAPPKPLVPRPNVIVYLVDTLRADHLGCYGYDAPTSPAIDQLASDGVLFEHARAQSSWTRPTAAAILTGLHPLSMQISGRASRLPDDATTLAEHLAAAGYRTGFVTTNVNTSEQFGFKQGSERFRFLPGRSSGVRGKTRAFRVHEEALRILDQTDASKPFLLYLHTVEPHAPYLPLEPFGSRFVPKLDNPKLGDRQTLGWLENGRVEADPETMRQLVGLYDAEIAGNDFAFAELVAALEARGLWENTLVVFVSDHGEEFLEHGKVEHGRTLYEEQLRVPLIFRLPGDAGAGKRVATPVEQIDILPTLLELVGVPVPPQLPGRSLVPALEGRTIPERPSFAHLDRLGYTYASVHDRGSKLIRRLDPEVFRFRVSRELFELGADPGEQANRFHDLPVLRALLDSRLRAFDLAFGGRFAEQTGQVDAELEAELRALGYLN